jgi:hypothetical protein
MADDGLAGWLIPSEFMEVNYGKAIKNYLLEHVTLMHITVLILAGSSLPMLLYHRLSYGSKASPQKTTRSGHFWRFIGPSPDVKLHPSRSAAMRASGHGFLSRHLRKLSRAYARRLFSIKHGLATGDNSYFILSAEQIVERDLPQEVFRPILPSPRYIPTDEIMADKQEL